MIKGLEFASQQMPGPQSQLGGGLVGLMGGRGRKPDGEWAKTQALSQGHNQYYAATTHTHTHTSHTHTNTDYSSPPSILTITEFFMSATALLNPLK